MKLIDKYLILLCVFVCFSCNYLEIVPDENPTEEDAFKNPQLTERYLYSCAEKLRKVCKLLEMSVG